MTDSFTVWTDALLAAETGWRDHAQELEAGTGDLVHAESLGSSLGPGVAGDVASFLDAWITEMDRYHDDAVGFAETLGEVRTTYVAGDDEVAAEVAALLPWDQYDLRPEGGV